MEVVTDPNLPESAQELEGDTAVSLLLRTSFTLPRDLSLQTNCGIFWWNTISYNLLTTLHCYLSPKSGVVKSLQN